jgi:hypothetical protein
LNLSFCQDFWNMKYETQNINFEGNKLIKNVQHNEGLNFMMISGMKYNKFAAHYADMEFFIILQGANNFNFCKIWRKLSSTPMLAENSILLFATGTLLNIISCKNGTLLSCWLHITIQYDTKGTKYLSCSWLGISVQHLILRVLAQNGAINIMYIYAHFWVVSQIITLGRLMSTLLQGSSSYEFSEGEFVVFIHV